MQKSLQQYKKPIYVDPTTENEWRVKTTKFLCLSYGIYSIFEFLPWCKQSDCVLTGNKVLWEP